MKKIFTLFALALSSMDASGECHRDGLNGIVDSIIHHTPGGIGVMTKVDDATVASFMEATNGIAYFNLRGIGHEYSVLENSNTVFNAKSHFYALVVGNAEFEGDRWSLVECRNQFCFYRRPWSQKSI